MPWPFWGMSIACALLPDADVIGFVAGVNYEHMLGHRGLSHSLPFAAVLGIGSGWLATQYLPQGAPPWWSLALYFTLVTASHGVLDAMTSGGLGIAFLAPFDSTRYFFPWRPVRVSPISITAFFSAWGVRILRSELLYIWLPMTCLYLLCRMFQRRQRGERSL
jgi:inner membrane protein